MYCYKMDLVRLACVKPAASVRPEPGSNSPSRTTDLHRDRSGKSVGLGGNNPKDPVPNLLFFLFVRWIGIHLELTGNIDDRSRLTARTVVQSSLLFSRS